MAHPGSQCRAAAIVLSRRGSETLSCPDTIRRDAFEERRPESSHQALTYPDAMLVLAPLLAREFEELYVLVADDGSAVPLCLERVLSGRLVENVGFDDMRACRSCSGFPREGGGPSSFTMDGVEGLKPPKRGSEGAAVSGEAGGHNHQARAGRGRESMNRYEIITYWSAEDDMFIAEVPKLPGCELDPI
jgi:hypothetical protein